MDILAHKLQYLELRSKWAGLSGLKNVNAGQKEKCSRMQKY